MIGLVTILTGSCKRKDGLFDYCIEYVQKQYEILSFDASAANIYSDLYERLKNADAKTQIL